MHHYATVRSRTHLEICGTIRVWLWHVGDSVWVTKVRCQQGSTSRCCPYSIYPQELAILRTSRCCVVVAGRALGAGLLQLFAVSRTWASVNCRLADTKQWSALSRQIKDWLLEKKVLNCVENRGVLWEISHFIFSEWMSHWSCWRAPS